jgi:acylphosphatase
MAIRQPPEHRAERRGGVENEDMRSKQAKRWFVSGRVQGVGFRYFVQNRAQELGLSGWARNTADGRVEVYATGTPEKLSDLAAALHAGPPLSDVRRVEEREDHLEKMSGFRIT